MDSLGARAKYLPLLVELLRSTPYLPFYLIPEWEHPYGRIKKMYRKPAKCRLYIIFF